MSIRPRHAALALVPFLALSLTACGGPSDPSVTIGSEPPTSFTSVPWSFPIDPVGDWLTSAADDNVRIDVYQAGVAPSTEDSKWAYSDTDEPLFVKGDPVVVLQLVLTNTGTEDIVLPSGRPDVAARYKKLDLLTLPPERPSTPASSRSP